MVPRTPSTDRIEEPVGGEIFGGKTLGIVHKFKLSPCLGCRRWLRSSHHPTLPNIHDLLRTILAEEFKEKISDTRPAQHKTKNAHRGGHCLVLSAPNGR